MSADHALHWDPAIAALIEQAEKRGEARGRAEARADRAGHRPGVPLVQRLHTARAESRRRHRPSGPAMTSLILGAAILGALCIVATVLGLRGGRR